MSSNQDSNKPQDNEFEGQMEFMKQAIDNSLQIGNKFLMNEEYENAIEQFSAAVQVSEMLYGEKHINGAFPNYKYGYALFKSAVANRRALDMDAANDAHEDEEMEEQAKTNLQASSSNIQIDAAEDLDQVEDDEDDEAEGENDEAEDQEGEENGEENEDVGDVDDLTFSYHVLSGSLNLYKIELQKDPKNATLRDQMCQVYITMGDASLESENFENAIENYKEAESNIREYFGDQLRRLSEVLFLLGIAYEYQVDYQKSQKVFEEVKTLLTKRKSELDLEKPAEKEEDKDLDQLIKEVNERIQDAIMNENLSSVIADALQKQKEKETVKIDPELIAQARDVSSLIKRKRNDEAEASSNSKEAKTE